MCAGLSGGRAADRHASSHTAQGLVYVNPQLGFACLEPRTEFSVTRLK
ncbi:MAG: hypothetical protein AB1Z51_12510 [Desulfuromonadales bacterium]